MRSGSPSFASALVTWNFRRRRLRRGGARSRRCVMPCCTACTVRHSAGRQHGRRAAGGRARRFMRPDRSAAHARFSLPRHRVCLKAATVCADRGFAVMVCRPLRECVTVPGVSGGLVQELEDDVEVASSAESESHASEARGAGLAVASAALLAACGGGGGGGSSAARRWSRADTCAQPNPDSDAHSEPDTVRVRRRLPRRLRRPRSQGRQRTPRPRASCCRRSSRRPTPTSPRCKNDGYVRLAQRAVHRAARTDRRRLAGFARPQLHHRPSSATSGRSSATS